MSNRGSKRNNNGTTVRRRHRSPVPPSFSLPNRGEQCKNWLPIAKRELTLRAKGLNKQRLEAIEIIINRVIGVVFTLFSLNSDIKFKLNFDEIIDGLIEEWNIKLLSTWNGPKFRSTSWRDKKWEGKHGYYKLCKNWSDQNKSKVAHKFWVPLFQQVLVFIRNLSSHQFKNDQLLQKKFEDITTYSCFYSICSSKVAFPKTRALPLFLDTAMTKNGQIRRYLKTLDQNLNIFQFKEEESEKYNREQRICQAVKQRCVQYLGQTLLSKLNKFTNNNKSIGLRQFEFEIKYDTKGKIGRDNNPSSYHDNNFISHNDDDDHFHDIEVQDELKTDVSLSSSPSILSPSSSLTSSSSSSSSSSSISLPAPIQIGNEHEYLSAECEVQGTNLNSAVSIPYISSVPYGSSIPYGSTHGQTWQVRHSRYAPLTPFTPPQIKSETRLIDRVPVYGSFPAYYGIPYYSAQPIYHLQSVHHSCCCDDNNMVPFHCINQQPEFHQQRHVNLGYLRQDANPSWNNSINRNIGSSQFMANNISIMCPTMNSNNLNINNNNHAEQRNGRQIYNNNPLQPSDTNPSNYFN